MRAQWTAEYGIHQIPVHTEEGHVFFGLNKIFDMMAAAPFPSNISFILHPAELINIAFSNKDSMPFGNEHLDMVRLSGVYKLLYASLAQSFSTSILPPHEARSKICAFQSWMESVDWSREAYRRLPEEEKDGMNSKTADVGGYDDYQKMSLLAQYFHIVHDYLAPDSISRIVKKFATYVSGLKVETVGYLPEEDDAVEDKSAHGSDEYEYQKMMLLAQNFDTVQDYLTPASTSKMVKRFAEYASGLCVQTTHEKSEKQVSPKNDENLA